MAKGKGRCDTCKIRWTWKNDKILLRYQRCPQCGRTLKRAKLLDEYPTKEMSSTYSGRN